MDAALSPTSTPLTRRRGSGADAAVADDVVLLNYLVSEGRVAPPENDRWQAELVDLIAQARRNLARSEGTFVMGETYVRLFRVTRADVLAAGGTASRHRTGGVELDDPATDPFDPIKRDPPTDPFAHRAAVSHVDFTPRSSIPRGRMPTPADLEPLPSEVSAPPAPKVRTVPTTPSRVVLAAASVLLAAAVGTVLIAAWTPEREAPTQTVAATHSQVPALALPTATPTAKAQEVALARRPAASYVAPAPKTTVQRQSPSDRTRRATTQPKRQRAHKRTIPNPIPGLPPILLP